MMLLKKANKKYQQRA